MLCTDRHHHAKWNVYRMITAILGSGELLLCIDLTLVSKAWSKWYSVCQINPHQWPVGVFTGKQSLVKVVQCLPDQSPSVTCWCVYWQAKPGQSGTVSTRSIPISDLLVILLVSKAWWKLFSVYWINPHQWPVGDFTGEQSLVKAVQCLLDKSPSVTCWCVYWWSMPF